MPLKKPPLLKGATQRVGDSVQHHPIHASIFIINRAEPASCLNAALCVTASHSTSAQLGKRHGGTEVAERFVLVNVSFLLSVLFS